MTQESRAPETGSDGPFVVRREGALEVWTLNQPDRMNALSRAIVREVYDHSRRAAKDPDLRAVIVTGTGHKAFCAGADLKERQGMTLDEVRDFLGLYRVAFGALDALAKPTVAAINGVAYGGGLELALACDFRVAVPTALLGLPETTLGIIPGAGGTQRLTRLVGPARAKELILFGSKVPAADAYAMGILSRVANANESALDCAKRFVSPLLNAAPIAIGAALEAIDAAMTLSVEEGLSVERECYERTLESEDRSEALRAFAEKRPPVFNGR